VMAGGGAVPMEAEDGFAPVERARNVLAGYWPGLA
jgi:hypothetical protein